MIILSGEIRIPFDVQESALPALKEHIIATRLEPGNLNFKVTVDEMDGEKFHVYEEFKDKKSYETHQELGKTRAWGQISMDFKREYTLKEL